MDRRSVVITNLLNLYVGVPKSTCSLASYRSGVKDASGAAQRGSEKRRSQDAELLSPLLTLIHGSYCS